MFLTSAYVKKVKSEITGIPSQLLIDLEFVDGLEPEKCKEIRTQIDH